MCRRDVGARYPGCATVEHGRGVCCPVNRAKPLTASDL